jgi:hypothetical protein
MHAGESQCLKKKQINSDCAICGFAGQVEAQLSTDFQRLAGGVLNTAISCSGECGHSLTRFDELRKRSFGSEATKKM